MAPANVQGDIEADPAVLADINDDGYASSGYQTSTESLTSSIFTYIYENGRRYHSYFGEDKSFMPTDEKEQNRLDMHHQIFLHMLEDKLHLAPLEHPQRILDIGTGTGIWAIDMADTYPSAEVIGTDISPIQPSWVPPNCRFEVDDAEMSWTYPKNSFDFIHARNLAQAISDWPKLMAECYAALRPGGYVETSDLGCDVYSDDNTAGKRFQRFAACVDEAMTKLGRPQASATNMKEKLEKAGFVDVQVTIAKQPFGPWPKDKRLKIVGAMVLLNCETGATESYGLAAMTRVLGMSVEEATKICRDGLLDVRNKNLHMYNHLYIAYGRKPLDDG